MQKLEQKILTLADQCVKCGMCLPSCPTNKLTGLEGHSPRGRIALWQNIAKKHLHPTEQTLNYLNQCLGCGACENNCPAGVKFLELHNLGKNYLLNHNITALSKDKKFWVKTRAVAIINRLIIKSLSSRPLNKLAAYGLFCYQKLNLKFIPYLNSLTAIKFPGLSSLSIQSQTIHNTQVLLFTGCANNIIAQETIKSIITVLNRLGINVLINNALTCCGALYSHSGEVKTADSIIQKNQKSTADFLKTNPISHILTIDTGCHQQISKQFSQISVLNVQTYLLQLLSSDNALKPFLSVSRKVDTYSDIATIYVYNPCSQREQLKSHNLTEELLKLSLPNSTIKTISKGFGCCGAAGRYMLDHPHTAERLATQIIEDMIKTSSLSENMTLCTSNIGCAIHLQNILLKNYGIKLVIKHPITLICENLA